MNSEERRSDPELLAAAAAVLDKLRFTTDMPREAKWRTTEQLANEMGLFGKPAVDRLARVLREHEARSLDRLENGLSPEAVIRSAKYPDRTTALPLWGSVARHGPPWAGHRLDRSDPPEDVPSTLRVPEAAPHVFLSHTHQDADLALRVAETLATMGIGCWRFETHIDQRGIIADCVRAGIAEAAGVLALVTRYSIASLWVLTELHTCLEIGRPVILVVDASDPQLLDLLRRAKFNYPDEAFDQSVTYDKEVVDRLKLDYGRRESADRTGRYSDQVRDFLASLPSYLGSRPPGANKRVWRPALAFPEPPQGWSGAIQLAPLQELLGRLEESRNPAR